MATSSSSYIKNFIFGVEDSLVSTVGLLSGVASAGLPKSEIFLTGIVLIFVEAFSMGIGSFLSEGFVEDLDHQKSSHRSLIGSFVMFFSYFFTGFIPLLPYIFIPTPEAILLSISASLLSLLLLGVISALTLKTNPIKHGLRMLFMGGGAIIIGVIIGKTIHTQ